MTDDNEPGDGSMVPEPVAGPSDQAEGSSAPEKSPVKATCVHGSAPARQGGGRTVLLLFIVLGVFFAAAAGVFFILVGLPEDLGVAVVRIDGFIVTGNDEGDGIAASEVIGREIRDAADDPMTEAIVLRINSPGGTPAGAQEIIRELEYARERKPVVTSMGDIATSGAYYIAAYSDRIYADPDTLTGGLGTIWTFWNYSARLEKRGIKVDAIKSGDWKDMGADYRGLDESERTYAQEIVDASAARMINDILSVRSIDKNLIMDSRVIRGEEAKAAGLIDEIGNLNDAIEGARAIGR